VRDVNGVSGMQAGGKDGYLRFLWAGLTIFAAVKSIAALNDDKPYGGWLAMAWAGSAGLHYATKEPG